MAERARRPWRRWGWGIGGLAVAAAAGTLIAESVSGGATGYRTTTVTTASVASVLTVTGSVVPVERATAAFGVSGTVASVAVTVGQQVSAGATLATLTPTALQKAVTSAQAKLTAAEATLVTDESAQTTTSTGGTGTGGSTASASGGTAAVHAAQQAVVAAQQTADTAGRSASAALSAADTACGVASTTGTSGTGTGGGTHTGTHGATGGGTKPTAAATTGHGTGGSPASPTSGSGAPSTGTTTAHACTSALTAVLAAQTQVSTDQRAVTRAETSLAGLLSTAAASTTQAKSATGGAGSSTATRSGSATPSTSPATLATDQATIDADQATLITAQQSLAAARLTSPIAGTVAAVGLSVGESVAGGSTSAVITVIDASGYEATALLTSSQVPSVKVGDDATVTVAGSSKVLYGTVARVGPVDVGGGNTYPLVVTLKPGTGAIFTGSTAQIGVVTARANHVLVVPTSAVHQSGPRHAAVLTLRTGHEVQTTVTVGVVGDVYTQVTSGLRRGDTVVLADLAQAVPAATSTFASRFPGAGAFAQFRAGAGRANVSRGTAG